MGGRISVAAFSFRRRFCSAFFWRFSSISCSQSLTGAFHSSLLLGMFLIRLRGFSPRRFASAISSLFRPHLRLASCHCCSLYAMGVPPFRLLRTIIAQDQVEKKKNRGQTNIQKQNATSKKEIRHINLMFWVTPHEQDLIRQKMAQLGTSNLSAYLRKMAIDGLIVKLDMPELREMISLLRRSSNNLNQIAKRMNETGRVYDTDIREVLENQERLWEMANAILVKLAGIQ